ncbi:MAG: NYN domain-containing protein [Bacteroidota bacterium]
MQHVIIDGYNLIHAVPALKRTLLHDAESARELLIHSVSMLTIRNKFRSTIVFDGMKQEDSTSHKKSHAPVHVLYSYPLSADTKINQMIEQSKSRSQLIIVTSDREILNFARTCSCQTHTSRYFTRMLVDNSDTISEKSESSLSPFQIDEWLKIFGEK